MPFVFRGSPHTLRSAEPLGMCFCFFEGAAGGGLGRAGGTRYPREGFGFVGEESNNSQLGRKRDIYMI